MWRFLFAATAAAALLAGCASSVRHDAAAPSALVAGQKYASISIGLTEAAKVKLADNVKFSADALLSTVKRTMEARGMLATDHALPKVEILVKDMRVRSNFTAIMFGFMAGADSVTGDVIVRDPAGRQLANFEVSASYALGGIGGGQDDARMGWLYEKFTEHTINNLNGQTAAR